MLDHFDEVNLIGFPDNGGLDVIEYDEATDIFMIHTWS